MSITEKERLTCFFYYGGERRVLPNGTFHYVGGVSEALLIEEDVSYEELLSKINSCLEISMYDKLVFYNSKRDKTKYLRVKDDIGVKMLFYLNEDEVDVFVDKDPTLASNRESDILERNETMRENYTNRLSSQCSWHINMSNTGKKRLTCFCYYAGTRMVLPNGTFNYNGGVSGAMLIEDDVSYQKLLSKIGSCLNRTINQYDWSIFYNSKRDKTKYLHLFDKNGVEMLFHLNEGEVDVFVE